ncbi:hypothetical protein [Neptuniibacter sp. QD34_54]|uniref:hypothetical protein n=1 Tax=Neptuniibacter sp. QD34_54 TaxID=3398208 RepID=UPI0039F4A8D7
MKYYLFLLAIFSGLAHSADCGHETKGDKVNIQGKDYWVNSTSALLLFSSSDTVSISDYETLVCLKVISIDAEDIDLKGIDKFEHLMKASFTISKPKKFNSTMESISRIKELDSLSFIAPDSIDFSRLGDISKINKLLLNINVEDYSFLSKFGEISKLEMPAKGVNYQFLSEHKQVGSLKLYDSGMVYGDTVGGGLKSLRLVKTIKSLYFDGADAELNYLKGNRYIEELVIDKKAEINRALIESMSSLRKLGVTDSYGYAGITWYEGTQIDELLTLQEELLGSNSVNGIVTSIDIGAGYIDEKNQLVYADKLSLSEPNKCGSNYVYMNWDLLGIEVEEYKKLLHLISSRSSKNAPTQFNLGGCKGSSALVESLAL